MSDSTTETAEKSPETIEDRIARAMRSRRGPKMPEGMAHEIEDGDGYTIIGEAPLAVRHLRILWGQLRDEHAGLKAAHLSAIGTPEESAAEAAHMQNHRDAGTVREKIMELLNETFQVDGKSYSGYKILEDWTVAGEEGSADAGGDLLSRIRQMAEEAVPEHMRDRVKVHVGGGAGGLGEMLKRAMAGRDDVDIEFGGGMTPERLARMRAMFEGKGSTEGDDSPFGGLFGGGLGDILSEMAGKADSKDGPSKFERFMRANGDGEDFEKIKALGWLDENDEPNLSKILGGDGKLDIEKILGDGKSPFEELFRQAEGRTPQGRRISTIIGMLGGDDKPQAAAPSTKRGHIFSGEGDVIIVDKIEIGLTINVNPGKKKKQKSEKTDD